MSITRKITQMFRVINKGFILFAWTLYTIYMVGSKEIVSQLFSLSQENSEKCYDNQFCNDNNDKIYCLS